MMSLMGRFDLIVAEIVDVSCVLTYVNQRCLREMLPIEWVFLGILVIIILSRPGDDASVWS